MTQPTGPYSVPYQHLQQMGHGFDPLGPYLAPARRASILMFILGGLGFACGICVGVVAFVVPMEQFIQQSGMQLPDTSELNMTPAELIKIVYIVISVVMLVAALLLIILAAFVRGGGLGACITAAAITGLAVLLLSLQLIAVLLQVGSTSPLQSLIALGINVLMLALFGLQLLWLIQAARAAPAVRMVRVQMQSQLWQYQQQAYGYTPQPPPPPPA